MSQICNLCSEVKSNLNTDPGGPTKMRLCLDPEHCVPRCLPIGSVWRWTQLGAPEIATGPEFKVKVESAERSVLFNISSHAHIMLMHAAYVLFSHGPRDIIPQNCRFQILGTVIFGFLLPVMILNINTLSDR